MTWIPIREGTRPTTQRTHLVTVREPWNYRGERFRYRVALATYVHKFTDEYDGDYPEDADYNEAADEYYAAEGWYETGISHPDYGYWPLEGDVVAIQPAPKPWKPETPE